MSTNRAIPAEGDPDPVTSATGAERFSWSRPSPWLRGYLVRNYPLRKLLPDREPAYVSSVLYLMGVLTLAALICAIISGAIIALGGVSWWHTNSFGAFMNSIHFWSVQAMFLFMAVHFITDFFTMGWRGGRGWTWITGVAGVHLGILTAFTGFLMMTNWDSQWVGQQAKDAFNALGIGAIWNVMNAGQAFTLHVVITLALLLFVVSVHIALIRRRGVAPPPGAEELEVPEPRAGPPGQGKLREAQMATGTKTRTRRHPLRTWQGPERPYDLIAEGTIAVIAVGVLCIIAAVICGARRTGALPTRVDLHSPAGQAFSARYWDANDPSDLAQTAVPRVARRDHHSRVRPAVQQHHRTRHSRSSGSSRPRSPRRSSA